MNLKKRRWGWLALLMAFGLVAAACGDDDDSDTATDGGDNGSEETENGGDGGEDLSGLSGTVRVDGSSTVGPLTEVAAELFMEETPVQVDVAISGTSGGFEKFCIGETDMNNSSRPIKEEEVTLCGENEIGYDQIQTANDALALLVNNDNPVDCLTVEQASQIWDDGSSVSSWGDIDGLDAPDDFKSNSLTLYGPGTDSGTFDFFTEVINGEEGRIRVDYIDIGEDDNAAVTAVIGDVAAMGYVPYSYFQEAGDSVKPLAIDNGEGCVEATLDNVQDGSYAPLGRPLFVYASDTALARPEVLAFMDFYIENADTIGDIAGFIGLTQEQIEEQQEKIAALVGS